MKRPKSDQFKINLKFDVKIAKFISFFIVFVTTFYLFSVNFESRIPVFNQKSIAKALFFILKNFGSDVSLNENRISFPDFSFVIVRQCTGIFELISLFACILAYPTKMKNKLIGIIIAMPVIYSLNMLRLIFLSFIAINFHAAFDIIHKYIFQVTFASLIVMLWVIWIDLVRINEGRD